jgi:hypothetical protein
MKMAGTGTTFRNMRGAPKVEMSLDVKMIMNYEY